MAADARTGRRKESRNFISLLDAICGGRVSRSEWIANGHRAVLLAVAQTFGPENVASEFDGAVDDLSVPPGDLIPAAQPRGVHQRGMVGTMDRPHAKIPDDLL